MIDFRYHVVSIIAVFLALSVGLVLGSSFLADIVSKDLDGQIRNLSRTADGLRHDLSSARTENDQLNSFINQSKPQLVKDLLKGRSVVVVTLPGADSDITDATTQTLQQSGATVTGTVAVKSAWTDPAKESTLLTASGEYSVSGQTSYDRAAAALAQALVHKSSAAGSSSTGTGGTPNPTATGEAGAPVTETPPTGSPTTTPATGHTTTPTAPATGAPGTGAPTTGAPNTSATEQAAAVLTRFKSAGFVDVKGNPEKGATLAVVIAPSGPLQGNDVGRTNQIYLGLSRTLDAADDGTVMAGDTTATQDGGTLAALRRDDRTAKVVSSVDGADTNQGQVSVDWALVVESKE
ncbi:MAG: copper transporter, partial [Streptomycetaceae bacterium]|nr:copper transporter [Streptomycetaceae bacterium]